MPCSKFKALLWNGHFGTGSGYALSCCVGRGTRHKDGSSCAHADFVLAMYQLQMCTLTLLCHNAGAGVKCASDYIARESLKHSVWTEQPRSLHWEQQTSQGSPAGIVHERGLPAEADSRA